MTKQARNNFVSALALITWAGTRYYAVEIVRYTAQKVWVALNHALSPCRVRLPSGSVHHREGPPFLVPKQAIRYVDGEKCERSEYEGAAYGYGGNVDARR